MCYGFVEEIRKIPLLRIFIPFIIGIIIQTKFSFNFKTIFIFFIPVLVLFFLTAYFYSRKFITITGLIISIFFLSFGIAYTSVFSSKDNINLSDYKGGYIVAEILEMPKERLRNVSFTVRMLAINSDKNWLEAEGKILLYLEKNEKSLSLKPGDKIIFTPDFSEIKNNGNPEEFDLKQYLTYNLILSSDFLSSDEWQKIDSDLPIRTKQKFLRFRDQLIEILKDVGLNNDELAVASALTLGYKDKINDSLKRSYSSSGAMHILAVSGLHVGIIYGIIVFLLSLFKLNNLKLVKFIIVVSSVWFYALLAGGSPSITRAALMISVFSLGETISKHSNSINSLLLAAFIILLIKPFTLFDLGFQFSFVAVLGILLFYTRIYELFSIRNKILDKIWSLTAVSIAAQLATFPLGLYYFNQFSNYFLITNYCLIPLATIAIWLTLAVFVFYVLGFGTITIGKILAFIVKLMNNVVVGIESLPFSVTKDVFIDEIKLALIYLILLSFFIFFFLSKEYRHLVWLIVFLIIYNIVGLVEQHSLNRQKHIVVYNIDRSTAINLIDGRRNVMFANLSGLKKTNVEKIAKNFWMSKGVQTEKYINLDSGLPSMLGNIINAGEDIFYKNKFIGFYDKRIFVLDKDFLFDSKNTSRIAVDYIIISDNPDIDFEKLQNRFEFEMLVIDSSNSLDNINKWVAMNKKFGFKLHIVPIQGAFVI
ncbi:MAG TPA: ComEC/Rec2 family competence protein [Bacteroidales bacterium]|nr:ComEC/Rec2 family competence protein [Bacteroidales bacterium]HOL98055.1 ComEC/Rec2 family competence protein [Bacteroidales bacterium]HOM37110.1 ComEC/Rec2 family competence protein [Bacteroidales bacterium]HPD23641.1 ComEC/Rec2 family competence protein [Bacteroidales bacterium]HRS99662.1 ComEC/Rec2 family competence protein [Bacteroidales bacterium]